MVSIIIYNIYCIFIEYMYDAIAKGRGGGGGDVNRWDQFDFELVHSFPPLLVCPLSRYLLGGGG